MKREITLLVVLMATCLSVFAQQTATNEAELKAQREKALVGVWQLKTVKNGVKFFQPEYKYVSADHTWFTMRTNRVQGGIYAGGTWKMTDANTIVEYNEFSITPMYIGQDITLHINQFDDHSHQITFTPLESNFSVTFDYEKVPTCSNGYRGPLLKEMVHFCTLDEYPFPRDGKPHYFRVKDYKKEEITLEELPAAIQTATQFTNLGGGKPTNSIYVLEAYDSKGNATSCIKPGANYSRTSPHRIYFDAKDAQIADELNEYIMRRQLPLEDDTLYYLIYKEVR